VVIKDHKFQIEIWLKAISKTTDIQVHDENRSIACPGENSVFSTTI
jgi:hypothetical protein